MAPTWADKERSDKFCSTRPEEQRIITVFQDLLDQSIDAESAAHTIATTYKPRLLEGEKISNYLFSLQSRVIIHPTTTLENHQQIVEMLLHLSSFPMSSSMAYPARQTVAPIGSLSPNSVSGFRNAHSVSFLPCPHHVFAGNIDEAQMFTPLKTCTSETVR